MHTANVVAFITHNRLCGKAWLALEWWLYTTLHSYIHTSTATYTFPNLYTHLHTAHTCMHTRHTYMKTRNTCMHRAHTYMHIYAERTHRCRQVGLPCQSRSFSLWRALEYCSKPCNPDTAWLRYLDTLWCQYTIGHAETMGGGWEEASAIWDCTGCDMCTHRLHHVQHVKI